MGMSTLLFSKASRVFVLAALLRAVLLVYGHYHDQHSALKYTDIDYYVFTDASRYVAQGQSPYLRDTYRYTPLLAWLLVPTARNGLWFDFGKVLFAASDLVAGWLILQMLENIYHMPKDRALRYASLWLLNPMVAQISTRGSSEGLLAAMVMGLLWACLKRQWTLAGIMLGVSVHFKIYPFIYAASIIWWLNDSKQATASAVASKQTSSLDIIAFLNRARLTVTFSSLITFLTLNVWMTTIYGEPFLHHSYLYHLIRTDHRHNFSIYNMLLYMNSSPIASSSARIESLAFLPQLALTAVILPIKLARKDLASCMLAQTFSFVTFNKVCTSQYFLWFMVFLPFYLPGSSFLRNRRMGTLALIAWILGQVAWLQQGFSLEFLGKSTFVPGIFSSSVAFFCVNIWILGVILRDVRQSPVSVVRNQSAKIE